MYKIPGLEHMLRLILHSPQAVTASIGFTSLTFLKFQQSAQHPFMGHGATNTTHFTKCSPTNICLTLVKLGRVGSFIILLTVQPTTDGFRTSVVQRHGVFNSWDEGSHLQKPRKQWTSRSHCFQVKMPLTSPKSFRAPSKSTFYNLLNYLYVPVNIL